MIANTFQFDIISDDKLTESPFGCKIAHRARMLSFFCQVPLDPLKIKKILQKIGPQSQEHIRPNKEEEKKKRNLIYSYAN